MKRLIKLIAAVAVVVMAIALVVFTLGLGGVFVGALATFSTYMFTSLLILGAAAATYLGVACFSPSSAKEGSDAVVEILKKASSSAGEIGGVIGNAVGTATGNVISSVAGGISKNFFPVLLLCGTGLGAFLIYKNFSPISSSTKRKGKTIGERERRLISSTTRKDEDEGDVNIDDDNINVSEDSKIFDNKRSLND